jgi:hypothetical protein
VDGGDAVDPDLARLDVDRDLRDLHAEGEHLHAGGVRPPAALAEDLRIFEQADDLLQRSVGRAALLGDLFDLAPGVAAAARTAGPIEGVVDDPAEIDAKGPRAESPSETVTCASGMPSSSAAICAIAVRVPVPMSCIAVTTVARPSEPTRTHA